MFCSLYFITHLCKSSMKFRLDIAEPTPKEWIDHVLADFPAFLQDHANNERKVSSVAMSFVAKYPDRAEIIDSLIETALEELEHFREVYQLMYKRGIKLLHEIEEDCYMKELVSLARNGRDERFLDRLIIASLVECRGAERFKIVYEHISDLELKNFYHKLWASEAKHSEIYIKMAMNYFSESIVYSRLKTLCLAEAKIMLKQPLTSKMH